MTTKWRYSVAVGVLALVIAASPAVHGAEFVVTTTADVVNPTDSVLSLREAILAANGLAGDDTVLLGSGTYSLTIGGSGEDAGQTGDLDVTDASGDLIILATGDGVVIDATQIADRVLDVHAGATLEVQGLTISGGSTPPDTVPPENRGGGIRCASGDLRVRTSVLSGNTGGWGAGLHVEGPGNVSITDSEITGNIVPSPGPTTAGGRGGGILGHGDSMLSLRLTIERSTIRNNLADSSGGGISFSNGILTVRHSTISGNSATTGGFFGAGIDCGSFTIVGVPTLIVVEDSTISDNGDLFAVNDGGGISLRPLCQVEILRSTISGNRAFNGGGVSIEGAFGSPMVTIDDSTVAFNSAGQAGGGIYIEPFGGIVDGSVTMRNSVLGSNSAGDLVFGDGPANVTLIDRNLIQTVSDPSRLIGDVSISLLGLAPGLGGLRDNEGLTATHAPFPGSPVIDAGSCSPGGNGNGNGDSTHDQRGQTRPVLVPTARDRRWDDGCDIGAVEFNSQDLDRLGEVRVPTRWCVLQGTSATEDPLSGGPNGVTTDRILNANAILLEESDTRLFLRQGANSAIPNVQVLQYTEPDGIPGDVYVDIEGPDFDFTNFARLINECREKWANLPGGTTAVLIRRFVDAEGSQLPIAGIGGRAIEGDCPAQLSASRIMVIDGGMLEDQTCPVDLTESIQAKFLSHEAGHAFSLRHGHGLDTNDDGNIDDVGDDSWNPLGSNLMEYGEDPDGLPGSDLNQAQTFQSKMHAVECVPGSEPHGLVPLVADLAAANLDAQDSDIGRIKIISLGIVVGLDGTITFFTESLATPLTGAIGSEDWLPLGPLVGTTSYKFLADLDHDPATGGEFPDEPDLDAIGGLELIGEVTVTDGSIIGGSLRVFEDGVFVEQSSFQPAVRNLSVGVAQFCEDFARDDPLVGASIQFDTDADVFTDAGWDPDDPLILVKLVAKTDSGDRNVVPPGPSEKAPLLGDDPEAVGLPDCAVEPSTLAPESEATLTATGFLPETLLTVTLGDAEIDSLFVDIQGDGSIGVAIPFGTPAGRQAIEVRDQETALQALCVLTVTDEPLEARCKDMEVSTDQDACSATVSVDAGSGDPNGDPVTIQQEPPGPYGLGITEVVLTVTGNDGSSDSCEATVTVVDATPPDLSVSLSPTVLWPPNHKMAAIVASVDANDACGPTEVVLESITSNEPDDAPGKGDGKTVGDIQGASPGEPDFEFELRAERAGSGDGRTYGVTYTATDAAGNAVSVTDQVVVPHDAGGK